MGGAVGIAANITKSVTNIASSISGGKVEVVGGKDNNEDKEDEKDRDNRRRNSLAFYVAQFVNFEGDDFGKVIEAVKADKYSKNGGKAPNIRNSSKCSANFVSKHIHRQQP